MTDRADRQFDIVLWGATGFTGRLVAEYLLTRTDAEGLSWAMAARSEEKLKALKESLGNAAADIPLLVADSRDRESLDALVADARVILTTVGPYALYGSELVAACTAAGTDYVDLAGEVQWMRKMIDAHQADAEASGARIVHCCGFDSIPSDMGVFFMQQQAHERFGAYCTTAGLRVRAMKGGASGGTIASMLNLVEEARKDPKIAKIVKNPYALNPPEHRKGPRQASHSTPSKDPELGYWLGPFVMATVNTRVVHRSNALAGFPYTPGFRYDEASIIGRGLGGRVRATAYATSLGAFMVGAAIGPARAIMKKTFLPEPGEGPDRDERENGYFNMILWGHTEGGDRIRARVKGDRDPGYGSTSKMIAESAICMAREVPASDVPGGFWTPATAMGSKLIDRLQAHAGLTFSVDETS